MFSTPIMREARRRSRAAPTRANTKPSPNIDKPGTRVIVNPAASTNALPAPTSNAEVKMHNDSHDLRRDRQGNADLI